MIRARVTHGRLVTPQRRGDRIAPGPPVRSHEMVVACGTRDHNGHQTCRGTFGSIYEEAPITYGGAPGHKSLQLDAIFQFEPIRETWRPTNHALKQKARGERPSLRRRVVQDSERQGETAHRYGPGSKYRDLGVQGEWIYGNLVDLPIVAECPRCGDPQTLPVVLVEEASRLRRLHPR